MTRRYALIVSLKSRNADIDLYTPIRTFIEEVPVSVGGAGQMTGLLEQLSEHTGLVAGDPASDTLGRGRKQSCRVRRGRVLGRRDK